MKRILPFIFAASLLLSSSAAAHPGRTDANGGHTCRTNCEKWGLKPGEYHYHNGGTTSTGSAGGAGKDTSSSASGFIKADKVSKPSAGKLSIYFLNVGQGDATYIKTAAGDDILIDAGKNEYGAAVVDYLRQLGVDDLEVLISTHPDADHSGGLDDVLHKFKVESIYAPKVSHNTNTFKDFLLAVKAQKLMIKEAKAGVVLPLKGVTAKFVGPVKPYGNDLNDWSAVLYLTYGKSKFLFTGDAETKSETDMLIGKQTLKADVLKVGHHGSKSSTSSTFLKAVSPKYAVISVGKNNYGHPTPLILNRLTGAKATTFRTDVNGTVTAISDGKAITFKKVK